MVTRSTSCTLGDLDRLEEVISMIAGLSAAVTQTAVYDKNGNRTQLAAKIGSTNDLINDYTYDAMNCLTLLVQGGSGVTLSNTVAAKRVDFGYNLAGQMTSPARAANIANHRTRFGTRFKTAQASNLRELP